MWKNYVFEQKVPLEKIQNHMVYVMLVSKTDSMLNDLTN